MLLLEPQLVQPELDDVAGHIDLNFHGKLKDWEEGSPRLLCPITAAGQSPRVLPRRFHARGLGLRTSCFV